MTNKVVTLKASPTANTRPVDVDAVCEPLGQAKAVLSLLQGAAAFGAIEPPTNGHALAETLNVVLGLLEQVEAALSP